MVKYIIKRILLFVPMLMLVSFIAFFISSKAPGDPVDKMLGGIQSGAISSDLNRSDSIRNVVRHQLGLDQPLFYFSIQSLASCDTLYRIQNPDHREALDRLTDQYGNWSEISDYYILQNKCIVLAKNSQLDEVVVELMALQQNFKPELIQNRLDQLNKLGKGTIIESELKALSDNFQLVKENATSWKNYLPSFNWTGAGNQYHQWLFGNAPWFGSADKPGQSYGVLRGDFGVSYQDGRPVMEALWPKLLRSFKLIFIAVILAYLISVPTGVYMARWNGSWAEKGGSVILFMLYSLPGFFVGTMLLFLFANSEMFDFFPESGYQPVNMDQNLGFWEKQKLMLPHMVLPIITYAYSGIAYISKMTQSGVLEVYQQDYILTARAKGMSENRVVWLHAFRNSLLPIITVFTNILPMIIGGSVIVEFLFQYDGMGKASYDAFQTLNYPVIIAIFTLGGFFTMLGYLFADILYVIVDPRIQLTRKNV